MNTTLPIAALIAACSTVASAQLRLIDLPTGFMPDRIAGVADGGTAIAASLVDPGYPLSNAFVFRGSTWRALEGRGSRTFVAGLSADGLTTLYTDFGGDGLVLDRAGTRTVITPRSSVATGSLTRDGSTVFFGDVAADGSARVERWQSGMTTTSVVLGDRYQNNPEVLAGSGADRFVFRADIANDTYAAAGPARSAIFADGAITEIPTLEDARFVRSWARATNADASVVVGLEQAWDSPNDTDRYDTRPWVYRDGSLTELVANGFTTLIPNSISDDGSLILAYGITTDALGSDTLDGLLFHADGRTESVTALLADAGLSLGLGEWAQAEQLSPDGQTIAGTIFHLDDLGAQSFSYFTLTVPAPAALLPLAGLCRIARRRR